MGYVIFTNQSEDALDHRFEGQALPTGSIPLEMVGRDGERSCLHNYRDDERFGETTLNDARQIAEAEALAFS